MSNTTEELFLKPGGAPSSGHPGGPILPGHQHVLADITDVFSNVELVAFTQGIRPGLFDELDEPPVGAMVESSNDGHLYWIHRDGSVHLLCDSGGYGGAAIWGSITGTLTDQTDLVAALNARQPAHANLTAFAGITGAAGLVPKFTGPGALGTFTITAAGETLLAETTVAGMVDTLGGATATGTGGLVRTTSPALLGTPTAPTATSGTNTTQVATTAFVLAELSAAVSGLLDLKGSTDCSANPNYPAGLVGDVYYVTVAGKIGGASGKVVDVGDAIVCKTNNAGGTEASVGTNWFVLEKNLAGALLAANNFSDITNAATARANLGLTIGTHVQAQNANLEALANLIGAADQLAYFTAAGTMALATITSVARTVFAEATLAGMVNQLGGATSTGTGGLVRKTSPTFDSSLTLVSGTYFQEAYGAPAQTRFRRAQGSLGSPTQTGAGQQVGIFGAQGWTSSAAWGGYMCYLVFVSAEAQTSGANGGYVEIFTVATGTTTAVSRGRIGAAGNWGLGVHTAEPTALLDVNSDIIRLRVAKTPATSSSAGNAGDMCWDANYEYRCVATNTWKRAALSTF